MLNRGPRVGDPVVLMHPEAHPVGLGRSDFAIHDNDGTHAVVVWVDKADRVNVTAFSHDGKPRAFLDVPFVHSGESPPKEGYWCTWPE